MPMQANSQEQLCQSAADARLDDLLDFVIGAIREVGERPAGIGQHLLILSVYEPGQGWKGQPSLHGILFSLACLSLKGLRLWLEDSFLCRSIRSTTTLLHSLYMTTDGFLQ